MAIDLSQIMRMKERFNDLQVGPRNQLGEEGG